jgi:hypothetical protein
VDTIVTIVTARPDDFDHPNNYRRDLNMPANGRPRPTVVQYGAGTYRLLGHSP